MPEARAYNAGGTSTQPQRFVIAEAERLNAVGEAWISAANPSEVLR